MGASIQDLFTPDGMCFGCGPANDRGLGLRSYRCDDGTAVATWQAQPHHVAGRDVVNGGVLGTLLDCHTGAALAVSVHDREGRWPYLEGDPWATVHYGVDLLRPTPVDQPLTIVARTTEFGEDDATVEGTIECGGKVTARGLARWKRLRPR